MIRSVQIIFGRIPNSYSRPNKFHFVWLSLIRMFDSVGNTTARQYKISFCFALAYSYFCGNAERHQENTADG